MCSSDLEGAGTRLDILSDHEGIWGCTFVGECTKVCPKHVDPAGAIQIGMKGKVIRPMPYTGRVAEGEPADLMVSDGETGAPERVMEGGEWK